MPAYLVISAASLRGVTEVDANSPLEAVKRAAEASGGGGRYVCVAVGNVVYARADASSQTIVNVTQEPTRDMGNL